jgi:hypothetical protein
MDEENLRRLFDAMPHTYLLLLPVGRYTGKFPGASR